MKAKTRRRIGLFVIGIPLLAVVGLCVLAFGRWGPSAETIEAMTSPDCVSIKYKDYESTDRRTFVVPLTDSAIADQLSLDTELVPKQRCECKHAEGLIYEKGEVRVEVSLCDHCFDIVGGGFIGDDHYEMPAGFYARYLQAKKAAIEASASVVPSSPKQGE